MKKSLTQYRFEVGILICLFGIQYSRILMEMFGLTINITNYIFIIGAAFLFDIHKEPEVDEYNGLILFYNLLVIIWATASDKLFASDAQSVVFTLFCIVMILGLSTRSPDDFDAAAFLNIGWWTSGLFNCVLLYLLTNGFTELSTRASLPGGSDRLTLSTMAFAHLVFTLIYKKNGVLKTLTGVIFTIASIACVLITTRKGMTISFLVILIVHIIKIEKEKTEIVENKRGNFLLNTCLVAIVVIIATSYIPALSDIIAHFVTAIQSSVNGLLKGSSSSFDLQYNSGAIRNNNISNLWDTYTNEYSLFEILFGRGYYYDQVDFPYLQAFTDLGVLMGIFYLVVELFIPIKLMFCTPSSPANDFLKYYTIMTLAQNFYSGAPYGQYKFAIVITLAYATSTRPEADTSLNYRGGVNNICILANLQNGGLAIC